MRQLSWTDDMMLRAETPETPLQIQMLLIYDPSTAPGGKVTFKGILEELDARLHLADVFRRRLTELPGGLDRPYWVDDPSFDLEYHVRHIGLPQPGDWRQLCIQVARLHARQIDLRRPPWEITVIEGLNSVPGVPKGSFAMALKLHHCAVDGMASVQMIAAMHDLAADSPRPAAPDGPWQPDPLPTTANLLSRTAIKAALYPVAGRARYLASSAPKAVRGLAGLPAKLVSGVSRMAEFGTPSFPPKTRFNQTVSAHRVFEARFHDLDDFKRIKARVPGSTVNDVALAYVGGALRHYLDGHGELPDESLVAACPISLRDASANDGQRQHAVRPVAIARNRHRRPTRPAHRDRCVDRGEPVGVGSVDTEPADRTDWNGADLVARGGGQGSERASVLRPDGRQYDRDQRARSDAADLLPRRATVTRRRSWATHRWHEPDPCRRELQRHAVDQRDRGPRRPAGSVEVCRVHGARLCGVALDRGLTRSRSLERVTGFEPVCTALQAAA